MPILEAKSTLTDRYQTTVPDPVRRALKLRRRDRIVYRVLPNGTVTVERDSRKKEGDDPVLGAFLDFLARDMASHPARMRSLDSGLRKRARSLTTKVKIDLDAPLLPENE